MILGFKLVARKVTSVGRKSQLVAEVAVILHHQKPVTHNNFHLIHLRIEGPFRPYHEKSVKNLLKLVFAVF